MASARTSTGLEIAVVGMAGRFPGANSVRKLWGNLRDGVESITHFTRTDLLAAGVDPTLLDDPDYVRARGVLSDIDCFDAPLFSYSPREARLMDPQHRLFLECAWSALEDGGCAPNGEGRSIGVFAAAGFPGYLLNIHSRRREPGYFDSAETLLGNEKDHIATRVSYKLNLTGPSMAIQTACSSSLVAVHQACRSLLAGDCDAALAGGVFVAVPQLCGYMCEAGGALSRDGHTRAFDARSSGFVPGSGVGIVFLKRLADAIANRDPIRAVICGSAINNDGSAKVGYTAPSVTGQADAIAAAYDFAEIDPATVGYVEAHGAATEMGDPIEVEALARVFAKRNAKPDFCWLGSLKGNVGHLDAAAGVAGLIKTVLCLEHKEIPPNLFFDEPNPLIPFDATPFRVPKERQEWEGGLRRAAVSSLGLGGTNVHFVLEQYTEHRRPSHQRTWTVLPVSAQSPSSLRAGVALLRDHRKIEPTQKLEDVAYTLQTGRRPMKYRVAAAVQCSGLKEQALLKLEQDCKTPVPVDSPRQAVFMFPGGGAQHVGMAREVFAQESSFRETVAFCCERLKREIGADLRTLIFDSSADFGSTSLNRPSVGLPALFTIELALARLWQSWGVQPVAMIGHSLGEYTAACVAGVLSVEDALDLVALRGRLFESMKPSAMLSVNIAKEELRGMLHGNLSVAAINGPDLYTVAGPKETVVALQRELSAREEVVARVLPIEVASHCDLVTPILGEIEEFLAGIELSPPKIPYVSNLTGRWVLAEEVQRPSYWVEHLRRPVQFSSGLMEILANSECALLEVGPGQTLTRLAQSHKHLLQTDVPMFSTLPHPTDGSPDYGFLLNTVGQMWCAGVTIDWSLLDGAYSPCRVSLPTYCFDKHRFWIDPGETREAQQKKSKDLATWFYLPGFKPTLRPRRPSDDELAQDNCIWVVFTDDSPHADVLCQRLRAAGKQVVCVRQSDSLHGGEGIWLRPAESADYEALVGVLEKHGANCVRVVHLWQWGEPALGGEGRATFTLSQATGYLSVINLARALMSAKLDVAHLTVFSSGTLQVGGGDDLLPDRTTVLGPIVVIPQEGPHISCRLVDSPPGGSTSAEELADTALREAWDTGGEKMVAYRGSSRYTKTFERVSLPQPSPGMSSFKQGGSYLLVGGLGPVGRHIAGYLAEKYGARLSLVGRSALPQRDKWDADRANCKEGDEISRRIRAIQNMEAAGAQVRTFQADVADYGSFGDVVGSIELEWGGIDGVFHCAAATRHHSVNCAIEDLGPDESREQFNAKVLGLYNLARLFDSRSPDFFVVFSSNASILGGLGMAAYSAANNFVDGFCAKKYALGLPWLSVNWDEWLIDDGADSPQSGSGLHEYAMDPTESLQALERALATDGTGQIVVSTGALEDRLQGWLGTLVAAVPASAGEDAREGESIVERYESPVASVLPRNATETALAKIWCEVLGVTSVSVFDNFFELGGHSLLAVHLRSKVKKLFGRTLPLEVVFGSGTLEAMATALTAEETPPPEYQAIVPLRAHGTNTSFFCVHAASGVGSVFEPLCRHLGDDQPFFAFQARGLDGQEPPFADMNEMVSRYLEKLTQQQPSGPYFLGGWCAGGTIAYELAQRLLAGGHEVYLALADVDSPNESTSTDDTRDLVAIARTHARNVGVNLPLRNDDLVGLSTEQQLQFVLDQYKLSRVVPDDATIDSMQAHWDVFLATLRVTRSYRYQFYEGPIALFLAEELDYHHLVDFDVTPDFVLNKESLTGFENRASAWDDYTPFPVRVYKVPGYHSLMALYPSVEVWAERILDWMDEVMRSRQP